MRFLKIVTYSVFLLGYSFAYASEVSEPNSPQSNNETTSSFIGLMEKFCKLNSPEIVCECAISDIKAEANKFAHQNLKTYLYNKFPKIVEDCMITTGYVNSLKNRYSAFCYSQNAEDIKTHGTRIDLLKQKFPEKVNQCSCAQDVINNMDDRRFMQYSVEANQTYQKRVVCIKACLASSSKEQCQQQCPKTTSPVTQATEDKCGPLDPSPLKNWLNAETCG